MFSTRTSQPGKSDYSIIVARLFVWKLLVVTSSRFEHYYGSLDITTERYLFDYRSSCVFILNCHFIQHPFDKRFRDRT